MNAQEAGLIRTLAFHDAWGYPPTLYEWIAQADLSPGTTLREAEAAAARLIEEGSVTLRRGRAVFSANEPAILEHEARRDLFHRKLRKARRVAAWLARLRGVKFVALCNTTALAHARSASDIDFFIITEPGSIWQTRMAAVAPFKLMNLRPKPDEESPDAICLSFFMDASCLSLEHLQIQKDGMPNDPYLRYWFLSLLPLFDDGISERLWKENNWMTSRHPLAKKWIAHPDLSMKRKTFRAPTLRALEPIAKHIQTRAFPPAIKEAMNRSTDVVVTDEMLKFHTKDRRTIFRERYEHNCRNHQVSHS
jgi:hypothetical protein